MSARALTIAGWAWLAAAVVGLIVQKGDVHFALLVSVLFFIGSSIVRAITNPKEKR